MTAHELLHHCFSWEIAPGIAAPEGDRSPDEAPNAGSGPEAVAESGSTRTVAGKAPAA